MGKLKYIDVPVREYRCPECGEVVLTIPKKEDVPDEEEIVSCPNGHEVIVPKYRKGITV